MGMNASNVILKSFEELIEHCSEMVKKAGLTEDDIEKVIRDVRREGDLQRQITELKSENAELRRQVDYWKVVAEDVTQSHEYWHNRALQIEQAAQAVVDRANKVWTGPRGDYFDLERKSPLWQLIDNLAAVLSERESG